MASLPPRIAPPSQDWLLRATRKLEKSIFRTVEYKYKNIILGLKTRIKEYEEFEKNAHDDSNRLEEELEVEQKKVEDLETRLKLHEKPDVVVKDLRGEIFRVKSFDNQIDSEKNEKRKADLDKEIDTINTFREAPPSKILKIGPLPRSIIIPPPGSPRTIGKKRERSLSPKSSPRSIRIRKSPIQEVNVPVPQFTDPVEPSVFSVPVVPVVQDKKKRKRKRKKEKET